MSKYYNRNQKGQEFVALFKERGGKRCQVKYIYMICNAYESGVDHGQEDDSLPACYGDDDLNEAYHIGHEFGFEKWQKQTK